MTRISKRLTHIVAVLAIAAAVVFCSSVPAKAADSKYNADFNDQTGGVTVRNSSSGEVLAELEVEGVKINPELYVSGKYIYFTTYESGSDTSPCYLYKYNTQKKTYTRMKDLGNEWSEFNVDFVYKGSIYLSGWIGSYDINAYRYYIKSGKLVKIADGGCTHRYKNHIVCETTYVHGSFVPYPIYVYNTKTGNTETIISDVANYTASGKYLYVAKMKKVNYEPSSTRTPYQIIRYNLATGKKKTLIKTFKSYWIEKITKKFIYYLRYNPSAGKNTYYRYSMSLKKRKKLSSSAHRKLFGY